MPCQNFDHDVEGYDERLFLSSLPESSLRYLSPTFSQTSFNINTLSSTLPMSIQEHRIRLNEILQLALDITKDVVDDIPRENNDVADSFATNLESTAQRQRLDHHLTSTEMNQRISDQSLGSTNVRETSYLSLAARSIEEGAATGEDGISVSSEEDD